MESAAAPPSQSEQGCELARARRPALREADTRAPVVATTGGGVRPGVVPNGGPQSRHGAPKPAASSAGDDLAYVALMLRYLGRSGFLVTQAPNVRQRSVDFRNWSMFGRLSLMLPPVEEQRRVATHLADQSAKVGRLINETERFVELASERRSSLITAAVTGQIDVQETA